MAQDDGTLSALVGQLLSRFDTFNDLKSQVSSLGGQVAILGDNVCSVRETIYGNGKPGHNTRLHDVERSVTEMHGQESRIRNVETDVKDLKEWHEEWKREQIEQRKEMHSMRNAMFVSVAMLIVTTVFNIIIK
jgi:hypothetical protein